MSRNERIEKWLIPWAALFSGLYLGYSVSWKMENDGVRAIMTETYTRLHNDASFMEQCESMKGRADLNGIVPVVPHGDESPLVALIVSNYALQCILTGDVSN